MEQRSKINNDWPDFRHRYPNYPWKDEEINNIADTIEKYADSELSNGRCPTIAGFSKTVRIQKDNLYGWVSSGRSPRLAQAMDYLKACQEDELVNKSLTKEWDSGTAKLLLSSNHGYTERNTLQGEPGKPLQVEHNPRKATAEIIAEHESRRKALQNK